MTQTNGSAGRDAHPAGCACGTCDSNGDTPTTTYRPLGTAKVRARDEDFRIVRVSGNLFVCSKANGNCCCGWEEKGRMPFDNRLWSDEWEHRRVRSQLHLTFTGCLGPCATGNNALLQIHGRSIWLKDLNDAALVSRVYDYAETLLRTNRIVPPPADLREHVFERYVAPPTDPYAPLVETTEDADGFERLDPVCLMDVDPATARHSVDYGGRTIYFCAPGCKRAFIADPAAYLPALAGEA